MTEPITRVAATSPATVLRGAMLRGQPVSLVGRPRGQAQASVDTIVRQEVVAAATASAPSQAAASSVQKEMAQARELARQQGYREGLEQGLKEGRETGQRDGYAAGKDEILARAASVIAESAQQAAQDATQRAVAAAEHEALGKWNRQKAGLDALLAALPHQIEQRLEAAQDDMLALCMEAVVQVLGKEAVQPRSLQAAVRQVINQVKARPLVSVELHPEDLMALQSLPDWEAWCRQHAPGLQWIASARVELGGCIVTSAGGSLDARLDTQLQTLRSLLLASRRNIAAGASHGSIAPSEGSS